MTTTYTTTERVDYREIPPCAGCGKPAITLNEDGSRTVGECPNCVGWDDNETVACTTQETTTTDTTIFDLPIGVVVHVRSLMGELHSIEDYGHDTHVKVNLVTDTPRIGHMDAVYLSRWAKATCGQGDYWITDLEWASYAD